MIDFATGNILQADTEAIVNTVNCVGVMGKGIALQYKKAYPDNFKAYAKACRAKEVQPGHMFIYETGAMINPKYIVNFPTKRHWKGKSQYDDIRTGLEALSEEIRVLEIKSIAIPPLGSGLGGLEWGKVKRMIMEHLSDLPDTRIVIYEPQGTPEPKEMPIGTEKPKLTTARSLFIKLIHQYAQFQYRLTLLEIQKLAYFLQVAGQPLRLNYVKHLYGPYAHNLNKVLELLEGHYISGYGDTQKPDVEIELLPNATEAADQFLGQNNVERKRLKKVSDLVDGFVTPYGMELLSSVHWVADQQKEVMEIQSIIKNIRGWNPRKSNLFKPYHIKIAINRLQEQSWLS